MKAKDLAALAALGIAGKFAYDKYREKNAPASGVSPPGAKLGDRVSPINEDVEGEAQTRMNNYSNEGRGKTAKFADEDYSNEGRGKAAPDFSNEGRGKAAPDFSNEGRGKAAPDFSNEGRSKTAPVAVATPVVKAAVSRSLAPAAAQPAGYEGVVPASELGSQGFKLNTPAVQGSSQYSDVVPKDELGSQDFRSPAKRLYYANEASGAANPASLLTDAYGNVSRAEQHVDNTKKIANATPLIAKSSALANVSHATQAAAMARKRAADQAAKMDEIARLTELNKAYVSRRAKGGAVKKMASGGLASSKMSKPSGASRGDGIAQRGRTRGTLR